MKFHLGPWSVAAGALLSVALIGCNPPVEEKKDTPAPTPGTSPAPEGPAPKTPPPTDVKPADTPAPTPDVKPADTPPPKDETKPAEPPK